MLQTINVVFYVWAVLFVYKTEYEAPLRLAAMAVAAAGLKIW
ncbi:MAG: hypothetical protein R3F48_05365 [Candidatus Zixiibacteriota bacterium]